MGSRDGFVPWRGLAALDRLVTVERARAYAVILLLGYAAGLAVLLATLRHGLDAQGNPPGADFIIFYGVSGLTLKGQALAAYSPHLLLAAERSAIAASRGLFLWSYPPTFQLLVAPLALAPYGLALGGWSAAGLAIYLATLRKLARTGLALILALAFPGVFMNLTQGQTGFLLVGLLGGGLLLVDERPLVAGALFGLLAVKPHFGFLLPIILVAGARWRAFASAGVVSVAFCGLATLVFGFDAWREFLAAGARTGGYLAAGALPLYKDPSLFAALRQWGVPINVALAIHGVQALVAVVLAWRVWRGQAPLEIKTGVAVLATLISLPEIFDYDLALLAVPIAAAAKRADGAAIGTKSALVVLAVTPLVLAPLARFAHAPIGPAVLWWGLLVLVSLARSGELAGAPTHRLSPVDPT